MAQKILLARITNPAIGNDLGNISRGQATEKLGKILSNIVGYLITTAVIAFLFYFLFSSLKWITSQGEEQKVKEAREGITNSLIGLVITFCVYAVVKLLGYLFNISLLEGLKLPLVPIF